MARMFIVGAGRDQVRGEGGPVGDHPQDGAVGRPVRLKNPNVKYSAEEYDLSSIRTRSRRSIRRAMHLWRCTRLPRHQMQTNWLMMTKLFNHLSIKVGL